MTSGHATQSISALKPASVVPFPHPASVQTILNNSDRLTPPSDVIGVLLQRRVWLEAVVTVLGIVANSIVSSGFTWCATYVIAQGNFLSGQSPAHQSYASFCVGVLGLIWAAFTVSTLFVQSSSMSNLHFLHSPDEIQPLWRWMWQVIRKMWPVAAVSLVLTTTTAYTMASLPVKTRSWKLHVYANGLFVKLPVTAVVNVSRYVYKFETVEGKAHIPPYIKHRFSVRRVIQGLILDDWVLQVTMTVAIGYMQLTSSLYLESSMAIAIFTCGSLIVKLVIQLIMKSEVMRRHRTQVKTIYIIVALPTVLIDTQVRVVILRQPTVNQSIAVTLSIAFAEIFARIAKVLLLRWEIQQHIKRTRKNNLTAVPPATATPSGAAPTDSVTAIDRAVPARGPKTHDSLSWEERLLHFHAAELHADMNAEYLAITGSMAIYFFLRNHPKCAWTTSASQLKWSQQAVYLVAQVSLEIVVDTVCSAWELANGVPTHNAKNIKTFMVALFVSSSVMTVALTVAVGVNP